MNYAHVEAAKNINIVAGDRKCLISNHFPNYLTVTGYQAVVLDFFPCSRCTWEEIYLECHALWFDKVQDVTGF